MGDAELIAQLRAAFVSGPLDTRHVYTQHAAADCIEALERESAAPRAMMKGPAAWLER